MKKSEKDQPTEGQPIQEQPDTNEKTTPEESSDENTENNTLIKNTSKIHDLPIPLISVLIVVTIIAISALVAWGKEKIQNEQYIKQYSEVLEELGNAHYYESSYEIDTDDDAQDIDDNYTQDTDNNSTNNRKNLVIKYNGVAKNIDSSKCLNCPAGYSFHQQLDHNHLEGGVYDNTLTLYGNNNGAYGLAQGEYNFQFDSPVSLIKIGSLGNGGDEVIFFLKENGTVDYISPYEGEYDPELEKTRDNNMTVYHADDVKDVKYFLQASATSEDAVSGWLTVLAFRSDGYFYDLERNVYDWDD